MEAEFWLQRWREGRTGFHEGRFNRHLTRWWPELGLADDARVLVPLCGKAHDLVWLAERGHRVLGVELSEQALAEFRAEHGEHARITLLQRDVFELRAAEVAAALGGAPQGWYDRAALIALPPEMRDRYVRHLHGLLPAGARGLLVTYAYPQQQKQGPPFSVEDDEVRALYEGGFALELLVEDDVLALEPQRRAEGLERLHERVYRVERR